MAIVVAGVPPMQAGASCVRIGQLGPNGSCGAWSTGRTLGGMDDLEGRLEALREPMGTLLPSEVVAQRVSRRRTVARIVGVLALVAAVAIALLL